MGSLILPMQTVKSKFYFHDELVERKCETVSVSQSVKQILLKLQHWLKISYSVSLDIRLFLKALRFYGYGHQVSDREVLT